MPNPTIKRIMATWETPYSDDLWNRLREHGQKIDSGAIDADFLGLGPSLPDDVETRLGDAIVHRHFNSDVLYWRFVVSRAPASEPPDDMKELDARVGGRVGLAKLLASVFLPDTAPIAAFKIDLRIKESEYNCKILPQPLSRGGHHDASLALGNKSWLEQVGYRFEGGVNGLSEISIIYLHKQAAFSVSLLARGLLKLQSATWLPYADDLAEIAVNTFFTNLEALHG